MKKFEGAGVRFHQGEVSTLATQTHNCGQLWFCGRVCGWVGNHPQHTQSLRGSSCCCGTNPTHYTLASLNSPPRASDQGKPSNRCRHQPSNLRITKLPSAIPTKRCVVRWSHLAASERHGYPSHEHRGVRWSDQSEGVAPRALNTRPPSNHRVPKPNGPDQPEAGVLMVRTRNPETSL
jgi:hypothetical protein